MVIGIAHLQPIVALVAGILILLVPRLLNFIVAIYLISSVSSGSGSSIKLNSRSCVRRCSAVLLRADRIHYTFAGPWRNAKRRARAQSKIASRTRQTAA